MLSHTLLLPLYSLNFPELQHNKNGVVILKNELKMFHKMEQKTFTDVRN